MKTSKAIERPPQDRAISESVNRNKQREQNAKPSPTERRPNSLSRKVLPGLLVLAALALASVKAATVTGNLTDIGLEPLNTKLLFQPTNKVVNLGSSLNAGPAKAIETTNGAFSLTLAQGTYTVCLPLIPARHCFGIDVPAGTNTFNITNLLFAGFLNADDGLGGGNPLRPDP